MPAASRAPRAQSLPHMHLKPYWLFLCRPDHLGGGGQVFLQELPLCPCSPALLQASGARSPRCPPLGALLQLC